MASTLSFRPAAIDRDIEERSRPSLSYWQDAWIRFKANRRALASLIFIVGMLGFAFVGPVIWDLFGNFDPSAQDLDQSSKPPWASRTAFIQAPYEPWTGVVSESVSGDHLKPNAVEVFGDANTAFVRLVWDAVPNAERYRIYRHIFQPLAGESLGLPLGVTKSGAHVSYEDRLDIQPRSYWYSVVALDAMGEEFPEAATLKVEPVLTTTASYAIEQGWIDPDAQLQPGDQINMQLHLLGTDYLGRDMLARLMKGAQVSLFIGIVAPFLYIVTGVLYGAFSGFLGGRTDAVMMRFADFVIALPFLLFMILFKLMFGIGPGESGILPMVVALILLSWPGAARLVRGEILQIREEGYVDASRLLGTKTMWLILRHMIPNTMGVILVTFTFAIPSTIFTEAFLSFIGMGVSAPTPSWGAMCNDGTQTMQTSPHELIFPALFISATVLAFNLLGDGLRDALDARMRTGE